MKSLLVIFVIGIGLFLGFQNCSGKLTNFQPTPSFQASNSEDKVVDPQAPELPKTCWLDGIEYSENATVERYQFASVPANSTCAKENRTCRQGIFDGTFTYTQCSPGAQNVPQFSLSHNPGYRSFSISTQFLSVNGSQCKVQFENQIGIWTNLTADSAAGPNINFDCSSDLNNLKIYLPANDDWTGSYSSNSNIKVRLVKTIDESVIAIFPQTLKCNFRGFSETPTPDIDENCNLKWDDTAQGGKLYQQPIGNKAYGADYACAESVIYQGNPAIFSTASWMNISHFYKKDCNGINFENGYSYGGGATASRTGNLGFPLPALFKPGCSKFNVDAPDDAANWVYASPTEWSHAHCEYLYDKKTLYY